VSSDLEDPEDVECPFCHDKGFDLIGLKAHLVNGYCGVFDSTKSLPSLFSSRAAVEEEREAWTGVDLDGTLAEYDGSIDHIGKPISAMMNRVRDWLIQGKVIKIFTARANTPEQIPMIMAWLKEQGLPEFEITATKDLNMVELWDDRCVHVETNTGKVAP
jgi:hypothetical protein